MQTSPAQGFSSCWVVFGSACTTCGVELPSASGTSGGGRIVFGSAWLAGGLSGSLQQSNELNMYQDDLNDVLCVLCGACVACNTCNTCKFSCKTMPFTEQEEKA